jgi:hypothetical protein
MSDQAFAEPPPTPLDSRARGRLLMSNSTLAFVLAALTSIASHEFAHAAAGLLRGLSPTVYSAGVIYTPAGSATTQLITAATGPLFSLVLGIVVCNFGQSLGRGFGRLFSMWLGLIALQNFAGYLVIAPFAKQGDSGRVFALLGMPTWAAWVACGFGVVFTLLNGRLLAGRVMRYARGPNALRRTVLFPWLLGTGLVTAIMLLAQLNHALSRDSAWLIIASTVAVAIFAPLFGLFYRGLSPSYVRLDLKIPAIPLLVTLAAVAVFIGLLGSGISL